MRFEYSSEDVVPKVVNVLERFSLHRHKEGTLQPGTVFESVREKVRGDVAANHPVTMVLPAFPWKNPNLNKVLGHHADLGDELGLARLHHLCEEISKVYPFGARLILICDGPVYNGIRNYLVGVPDEDCYDYGIQLRKMAEEKHFSSIQFIRLMDLLRLGDGEKVSRSEYLRLVPTCRKQLMSSKFIDANFDVERELQRNPDTRTSYESYFARISEDLCWAKGFDPAIAADPDLYAAEVSKVAKTMIKRLVAYENLINVALGKHVRLSIHPSLGRTKISIPLLRQGDWFGDMPWHASVLVLSNGEIKTGASRDFRQKHDVVTKHGRPYYFREKSPPYHWIAEVEFQHDYEGLLVKNPRLEIQMFGKEDRQKLARLVVLHQNHLVRVEGFDARVEP